MVFLAVAPTLLMKNTLAVLHTPAALAGVVSCLPALILPAAVVGTSTSVAEHHHVGCGS